MYKLTNWIILYQKLSIVYEEKSSFPIIDVNCIYENKVERLLKFSKIIKISRNWPLLPYIYLNKKSVARLISHSELQGRDKLAQVFILPRSKTESLLHIFACSIGLCMKKRVEDISYTTYALETSSQFNVTTHFKLRFWVCINTIKLTLMTMIMIMMVVVQSACGKCVSDAKSLERYSSLYSIRLGIPYLSRFHSRKDHSVQDLSIF